MRWTILKLEAVKISLALTSFAAQGFSHYCTRQYFNSHYTHDADPISWKTGRNT